MGKNEAPSLRSRQWAVTFERQNTCSKRIGLQFTNFAIASKPSVCKGVDLTVIISHDVPALVT